MVRTSEKSSIIANQKSYTGFPTSHQPRFYAAPNCMPQNGDQIPNFVVFHTSFDNKRRKVCCRVSLTNHVHVRYMLSPVRLSSVVCNLSTTISRKPCKTGGKLLLITNRKSYMSSPLVSKSVTLNYLERRNGVILSYFTLFQRIRVASGAHYVTVHVRYLIS